MNRITVALVAALGLVGTVLAQPANPYNGKWTVSFDGRKTVDLEGSFVVKDEGGVWDARQSSGACDRAFQVRPNPSLKRRANGRPRYSSMFIMLPRGLPSSPA